MLAIASAIRVVVTDEEQARIARDLEVDPGAYDAYLKGWQASTIFTAESFDTSLDHFRRAQELDSDMASAWSGEARLHFLRGVMEIAPFKEQMEKARAAAEKARALDENDWLAESVIGLYEEYVTFNRSEARARYLRAVQLNPNQPLLTFYLGRLAAASGDWTRATEYARDVQDFSGDPFTTSLAGILYGWANQHEKALELLAASRTAKMSNLKIPFRLTYSLVETGRAEEVLTFSEKWPETTQPYALAEIGRTEDAIKILEGLTREFSPQLSPATVAASYVTLGKLDEAFEWVEYLVREPWPEVWMPFRLFPFLPSHLEDPNWIAFRTDSRFRALAEEANLPPVPPEHPGYAEEQEYLINKRAEELMTDRDLAPQESEEN